MSFAYEGAAPLLRDIDLTVEAGRTVALVGPTGSGKTTLVMLIPRLYDVTRGSVLVDGVDVRSIDPASLRREVAVVSDDAFLFSATLRDNIAYARPEADDGAVLAAAERAGLSELVDDLPDGLDTLVGERGLTLSGGQRQRVAIARALLAEPRILILDDATSSVDATTESRIKSALAEVMKGRTTFVIAHRLSTIALADEVVVIEDGRVAARGSHDELLSDSAALPRDRREGPARPGVPHARGPRARGGRAMTNGIAPVRASPAPRALRKQRHLLRLLRPYRVKVALMLLALTVATAAALAPPYLAGKAIDDGIRGEDMSQLTLVVVLFMVAAVVNWGASYAQTYMISWIGQRALQDLRLQLFAHLQSLSIGFYSRNRTGVLISRITNDVQALDQLVTEGIATLFSATLMLFGTAAILLLLDPGLALITFITFPLLLVASVAFRLASRGAYRLTREKIAGVTAYLQETLTGVRVVRAFGQEPRHVKRFAELNDEHREANLKTVYLNAAYFPSVELLSAVATAAILIYGGNQVIEGAATIGVLASFVFYLQSFFDPIQSLSQLYTTYQAGMAALDKIFELLDEEPDLSDKPDAVELPRLRGEIEFDDVSFSYAGHDPALCSVDLHIPPGQTVALVGATGAGKSTLAKLVARFYDPDHGRVLIDGHDLRDVTEHSLRSQLGIVPQEGFLFSGTIRDNIAFGRPAAGDDDVLAAARAVGAHDFIERLPDGYDTEVGERGGQLSAGQRQLVAFARAAAADPRILILDEATSNVDVRTESQIERGLRRLLAGRTALVIAHRLSTIRGAGRIVVLDRSRIVEQGTHDELIEADGAYAKLYRDWARQSVA